METTSGLEDKDGEEEVGTLKDSYPYYGDGSGRSEPMTIRSVRMRDPDTDPEVMSSSTTSTAAPKESKKKALFSQPKGTMEYTVNATDKLETIALAFDSTRSQLMRLNHLSSSMIFPGQKLYVPDPNSTEPVVLSPTNKSFPTQTENSFSAASSRVDIPTISMKSKAPPDIPVVKQADRPKKNRLFMRSKSKDEETGSSRERRQKYRKKGVVKKQNSTPIPGRVIRQNTQDSDTDENSKQFLKLDVKYITDGEGVVSGTMLVTPNAIMFDPNVSDPLVIDRGVGSYGVITQMDNLVGASMYHDISAMSLKAQAGSTSSNCQVYIPEDHKNGVMDDATEDKKDGVAVSSPAEESNGDTTRDEESDNRENEKRVAEEVEKAEEEDATSEKGEPSKEGQVKMEGDVRDDNLLARLSEDDSGGEEKGTHDSTPSQNFPNDIEMRDGSGDSNENVQSKPEESSNEMDNRDDDRIEVKRRVEGDGSDAGSLPEASKEESETQKCSSEEEEEKKSKDEDDEHEELNLAKSETVADDDQSVFAAPETQDSEIPKKQLEPSVATAEAQSSAEGNQAFVNFSSGLFVTDKRKCSMVADMSECILDNSATERQLQEIQEDGKELRRLSEEDVVREQKWPPKEPLQEGEPPLSEEQETKTTKTQGQGGVKLVYTIEDFEAESGAERPIKPEFRPKPAQRYEDPPLYLCVKVYRPMQKTFDRRSSEDGDEDENNGSTRTLKTQRSEKLPEYWFAIPRDKADNLYNFFLQWSPEKYGKEVSPDDLGFVCVEQTEPLVEVVEDFFNEPISKDWEIVSKEEANRRRMTLLECEMNLPLPQLLGESRLLDDVHIGKLRKELPPRTEGYNWSLIYNTASDGFSLRSLYRTMQDWECPVLLLLEDSSNYLFGALVSCPLKESEAYYGTGESFLFNFEPGEEFAHLNCYRWTGENMFFIKGDKDSISIGGGEGTIGLWLDGDLYHGRCRKCKTFDNAILSGTEDFVVKNLEVWGFVM